MHEGGLHDSVFGVLGYRLRSATGGSMKLKYGTNPHQAFAAAEPVAPGTEPLRLRSGSPLAHQPARRDRAGPRAAAQTLTGGALCASRARREAPARGGLRRRLRGMDAQGDATGSGVRGSGVRLGPREGRRQSGEAPRLLRRSFDRLRRFSGHDLRRSRPLTRGGAVRHDWLLSTSAADFRLPPRCRGEDTDHQRTARDTTREARP